MSASTKNPKPGKDQQPQWNTQTARGKVTTQCLWNACKALSIGLILLAIGTVMAVVGYYADQLSMRSEIKGNSTIVIKNESRGFHLNNLSYAGPIVMGIGGFIVVAACVMTFEARDSAAKVVPARFKPNLNSSGQRGSTKSGNASKSFPDLETKRNTGCQAPARKSVGTHRLDVMAQGPDWMPKTDITRRKAFSSAFVQFSRQLAKNSKSSNNDRWRAKIREGNLKKSPSAPELIVDDLGVASLNEEMVERINSRLVTTVFPKAGSRTAQHENTHRLQDSVYGNMVLRPGHLQRQAFSVDASYYEHDACFTSPSGKLCSQLGKRYEGSKESFEMDIGSNTSMALDLHDCQVTLKVRDESEKKRSDTAKRHQLLRQKPVEDERDDRIPICSRISKFLNNPSPEVHNFNTDSSLNLRNECYHCSSCLNEDHLNKISAEFSGQHLPQFQQIKRNGFYAEDNSKIFCVEDHTRKINISAENMKICCDEKLKSLKGHSPLIPPFGKCQICGYRLPRPNNPECLVQIGKDSSKNHPLARFARKEIKARKIEGSLSAEEQDLWEKLTKRKPVANSITLRSVSASSTLEIFRSSSYRNDGSTRSSSPVGGTSSPVTAVQSDSKLLSESATISKDTATKENFVPKKPS